MLVFLPLLLSTNNRLFTTCTACSAVLADGSRRSLVLIDELGKGTEVIRLNCDVISLHWSFLLGTFSGGFIRVSRLGNCTRDTNKVMW